VRLKSLLRCSLPAAEKSNGSVGGKADVHAHEEGKRNKSLLGHNAIFTPEVIDDIHIRARHLCMRLQADSDTEDMAVDVCFCDSIL